MYSVPVGCPTDLTDLHRFVFIQITKTDIHPLKMMEAEPWCQASALFFQEQVLNA